MVALPESLRAEVAKSTGLMQEEPAGPAARAIARQLGLRLPLRHGPVRVDLAVEKVQPRITVDSLVEARLQPERLTVDLTAVYTIEKAGVFTLDWAIPPGYEDFEVRQVRGVQVVGATPVEVDNFHTESGPATTPLQGVPPGGPATTSLQGVPPGGKPTRLIVNLSRKAIGRVALFVQFQKELHASALLAPADKPAQVKVLVPTVPPGSAQRATGRVVVDAPESLRVNPERLTGLRSVSFVEAFEGIRSPGPARAGRTAARAGLRLRRAAGRIDPLGRAPQAGNDRAAIAGRADRRRRGQVPAHALLQRALQRRQVAPARRAGGGGFRPARRYGWRARIGHLTPAEGPGPRRRGVESCRRDGVSGRGADRTQVGKEDRQARRGQIGRAAGSLFEAPRRVPLLGPDRAGEVGDDRRSARRRAEIAADDRPRARPDRCRAVGRQRLRVSRRLVAFDRRHAVPIGGREADQHRAGFCSDGRGAGPDHLRPGIVPDAERSASG